MKVLVFTPTWIDEHTGENAIDPLCERSVKTQMLADGDDFDWHVTADNPYPIGDHENILVQYQAAQHHFLQGRWEALFTVEHDQVLPPGTFRKMLETGKADVVYAPYMLRHGRNEMSVWQYVNDRDLGPSLSRVPTALRAAIEAVTPRVCGVGFGCTLMWRHVLEAIEFRPGDALQRVPDLPFAEDCLRKGFVARARMDAPVIHHEDGKALHPYIMSHI